MTFLLSLMATLSPLTLQLRRTISDIIKEG
jgi:hypothetical protein